MIDLSGYTPEQLKELQKQLAELTKSEVKPRKPKKLPKILKAEQLEKYLAAINTDTDQGIRQMAISQIMILAGLRIQEICDLTIDDVDLIGDDLFIQQSKNSVDRHVPIGATLKHWLEQWQAVRPEGSDYFFCSRKGTQLFQRNVREMVYRLADQARIFIRDGAKKAKIHPHLFRHVYATRLLDNGYNIRQVQALLGHKSVVTTQIYTEVNMEDIRKKIGETEWL
jgi:site-specific recombinase XerD